MKEFKKACYNLEYYDKHGSFPFEKKKVTITLSNKILDKYKKEKNFSALIESKLKH